MTTTVTTASQTSTTVVVSESGGQGLPGADGADGAGFNQVRKSKLDNPLCHLFKTNKLVEASAPTGTDSDVAATRAGGASNIDRYGIVQTVGNDVIREEKQGFLIEEARTNSLLYSEELDNAAWNKSELTVTPNDTTSPDGTATADKAIPSTNNAVHQINQSIAAVPVTQGDTYCLSVFAKSNGYNGCELAFIDETGSNKGANFDLDSGTITSTDSGVIARIDALFDGWFRCSIVNEFSNTVTSPSAGQSRFFIGDDGVFSFAGDGVSGISLWGAQTELGNSPSSYISTTASTVTRTADIVNYTATNNIGLLSSNNTIVADIGTTSGIASANARIINIKASGSTTNNQRTIALQGGNQLNLITFSGEVQSGATFSTDALGVVASVANFDTDTLDAYSEGSLSTSTSMSTSVFASTTPETISFIADSSGVSQDISTHIKDFRIYDFALNADEVEYLS